MNKKNLLDGLEEMIWDALRKTPELGDLDDPELSATIDQLIAEISSKLVQQTITALKAEAPKMLKDRHKDRRSFEKRCHQRWKKALNHLEMMIVMAAELGESNAKELRKQAIDEKGYVFGAISQLHPRAILVAEEILCLLRCGFPDGALARWRTLHEINVTAMFIAKHGDKIALNYLASFFFNARRAANQLNEYSDRANLRKFDETDLLEIEEFCEDATKRAGREMGRDYDWARPAISNNPVTLFDLEKDIEMDHWRPRFRWASQHNHAGHRPPDKLLGLVEAEQIDSLVGPSNSGFVDPLQMTAISLAQMTSTFMLYKPNLDRVIFSKIMLSLADDLGPMASNLEESTLENYRQKSGTKSKSKTDETE